MKDIPKIHAEAMYFARLAENALRSNDHKLFMQQTENAFVLEREAAMELLLYKDSEPSRSVLFRSAAVLAFEIHKFKEAERLIDYALNGRPPASVRRELVNMLSLIRLNQVRPYQYFDQTEKKIAIPFPSERYFRSRILSSVEAAISSQVSRTQLSSDEVILQLLKVVYQESSPILDFIKATGGSELFAKDILQEALVTFYYREELTGVHKDRLIARFFIYFRRKLKLNSIRYLKATNLFRKYASVAPPAFVTPQYGMPSIEDGLKEEVALLQGDEREVIEQILKGFSIQEISESLGRTVQSIRNIRDKAIKHLKRKLSTD